MDKKRFQKFSCKFEGFEDVFARMVSLFLQDVPQRRFEISSAVENRNWEDAGKAAHSLVNITGTMQAFESAELARKFEAAIRARAYNELPTLLADLDMELESSLAVVREYQENQKA
ncbi:Hpt domain-containing protein [Spirochaeta dissipatitropha]